MRRCVRDIQAISFDLDDTLWPIEPVIAHAEHCLHDWFRRHHPAVAERFDASGLRRLRVEAGEQHPELSHDFSALRLLSLRRAMRIAGAPPAAAEDAFRVFFQARNEVRFYDDVAPTLSRLAERCPLAAITNGNADLAATGADRWLAFSISAIQAGAAKPEPLIFTRAAERFGLDPQQILHVGDDPDLDVAGARAAGFQAVLLDREGRHVDAAGAETAIRSLEELPGWLEMD
jgi:FMN hydrolase / 5-amino-6-(5-phospho-D-ribitylamino)uracil phosphatase